MTERPILRLLPGRHRRIIAGHPWVYSNEVAMDEAAKRLPPGSPVTLQAADGRALGTAFFNPHSLIAARVLSPDPGAAIDAAFLAARIGRALRLREVLYSRPYYRLVHAEADGLPGLVIDRFGNLVVCQQNAAGMERLRPELLEALDHVLAPKAVVLRNDSAVRELEGLERKVETAKGEVSVPVEIEENGARFLIDPVGGQKTGWFFDQRENRAFVAGLARGRSVIDLYAYLGGFAIQAALAGAGQVAAVDASEGALKLAEQAAALNGVGARCQFTRAEAFAELARLAEAGRRFEIVICDPPAFIKSKRDLGAGARGYRKLARLSAAITAPGGFLFLASCSHHLDAARFAEETHKGIAEAGRTGRVLRQAGASPDHPVHPFLPESAYLKTELLALD